MQQIGKRNSYLLFAGLAVVGLSLALAGPAAAQTSFATGFEASEGYVAGMNVDGQNGWYRPNGASDNPEIVDTYSGGTLGLPQNPTGADQYIGQIHPGTGSFPRAQHNVSFSGSDVWTISYDTCTNYMGTATAKNNISSFSLQPSDGTAAYFIQLNYWMHTVGRGGPNGHGVRWKAAFEIFGAAGNGPLLGLVKPPAKQARELPLNNWYNIQMTVDFSTNQITNVVYTEIASGLQTVVQPTNWYMAGGMGGTLARPTAIRFFVGGGSGSDPGNIAGFDNLSITPGGPGPIGANAVIADTMVRPIPASVAGAASN
jgi:hypothetical protein